MKWEFHFMKWLLSIGIFQMIQPRLLTPTLTCSANAILKLMLYLENNS